MPRYNAQRIDAKIRTLASSMSLIIDGYNLMHAAGIVGRGVGPGASNARGWRS